ncbi:MAG: NlpC/P60 family protein, partial [Frankia sp.]|nr:NlpC/P60 family protein [Frankia sp.]
MISGWLLFAPLVAPAWASPAVPVTEAAPDAQPPADTIDGLNSQIVQARRELEELDTRLAAAAEEFNRTRLRLSAAEAELAEAQARVERADRTVEDAAERRRGLAASAYRAGSLDTLSAILVGDPGSALDRAGAMDALARRARTAETELRLARIDLVEARAGAQQALTDAQAAHDAVVEQKRIIEESAARQRTLLDDLVARHAELERRERERAAAAERARRIAEAEAAARAAEAAAAEQARLRERADLTTQAGETFAATPVTGA